MANTWTCQRKINGVRCGIVNPRLKQRCSVCGGPRPARRRQPHFQALELPYEAFLAANGGLEVCGVCGAPPKPGQRLDRDHPHRGAPQPRGLLCRACNRRLKWWMTIAWLRAAADYLEGRGRGHRRAGRRGADAGR